MKSRKSIIDLARELRQLSTPAEQELWEVLRNRRFLGKKFLRQHPLIYGYNQGYKFFIADFYCAEAKLVIELDGKIHEFQKEYDEGRDFVIAEMGNRVLRIKNEELEDMTKVKNKIAEYI
jgi:very-short-patch-repair endonuclease